MRHENCLPKVYRSLCLAIVLVLAYLKGTQGQELWVYSQTNLLVPDEIQRIEELMQRAKNSGYTHLLIADSKFSRLGQLDDRYFKNVQRIQKKATELQLKLVPTVCSVGYSNDILSLEPNLAEGLPVQDALFIVRSGSASLQADSNQALPALSDRRKWGFIDESLKLDGETLQASPPYSGNVRLSKPVRLTPFRHYHVSVQIKTQDFETPVEIKLLTKEGKSLNYTNLRTEPSQDWRTHHITFNSLDNTDATLYIGAWGPTRGTLSIRQPTFEECGAVNLVRRKSAPIRIELESEDGKRKPLQEGVDFEPWADPKLGNVPYAGEYDVWHEAPSIQLKQQLPDGSKLRVSYFHTHIVYDGQVCGTASDAQFEDLLEQQIERMTNLFPNSDFMMSHDEYRVMGWTQATAKGLAPEATPGQVLTHNVQRCSEKLLARNPKPAVAVWSDMFDPYHNAVEKYYLVNGSLRGSNAPDSVRIVNWNFGKRQESLQHFSQRGHQQILAGYYDSDPKQITDWLDTVVDSKIPGVQGVMYTTWRKNYSDLEKFAGLVKDHSWYSKVSKD
jgi:hypothetical protein